MARDKGQEIAVVATAQDVTIGEPGKWYTFVNDDIANDIYYRLKDENTMAGIASVIVATPIFGARLKADEIVHIEGGTWEVCCATGLTATLRVVPGRLIPTVAMDAEFNIGNVGLLNKAEVEIDPSEAQAANTAYVAADKLTPIGGVKSATRHTAAELETFADDDWVPVGVTDVHELRTRDDDANTDLDTLVTDAKISNVAAAAADRLAGAGAVRKDTEALPEAVADGDWVALQVDVTGSLRVTDDTGNGHLVKLSDTVFNDANAYTAGDPGVGVIGVRKDSRGPLGADDDYVHIQMTATGDLRVRDDDANTDLDTLILPIKTLGTDTYTEATTRGGVIGAVRADSRVSLGDTDNEIVPLQVTANGDVRTRDDDAITELETSTALQIERYLEVHILNGADAGNWVAGTDAANVESSTQHIPHSGKLTCIEMDKTGGTQVEAIMSRVIASVDASAFQGPVLLEWAVKHGNYTNVANIILRVGTDANNYHEWKIDPVDFETSQWVEIGSVLHHGIQTGTGLDMSDIDYLALGVEMDAAANTIADVQFEAVTIVSAPITTSGVAVTVDPGDIGNTVRVTSVGNPSGGQWPKNSGNKDGATPRVVVATDDINMAAINVATGNRDEVLSVTYRITVDQASDIFANQGGAALPAATTSIALIPEDDTKHITWEVDGTNADVNAPRLPATGIVVPITKAVGDVIEMWISAGTEYVLLMVYVPR